MLSPRRRVLLAAALLPLAGACLGDPRVTNIDVPPTPTLDTLLPPQVEQGQLDRSLTVRGSGYTKSSVVRVNGEGRATIYVSTRELRVLLDFPDLQTVGVRQVAVFTPAPGGGLSRVLPLFVAPRTYPMPGIGTVSPMALSTTGGATVVEITGSGFVPQSVVTINNLARESVTYVSATALRFTLTSAEVAAGGAYVVRVVNPFPGGGTSNAVTINVTAPLPVVSALGESSTTAGQTQYDVHISGSGFVPSSTVRVNGEARATTFSSTSALRARLTEQDLRAAGSLRLTVFTPPPGGGTSAELTLQLVHAVPVLALLPANGAHAGRSGFTLSVHGRGFVAASEVRWNGVRLPTQYLSATRLLAEISSDDVASPVEAQVTVFNPAPGGGTSASAPLSVRSVPPATVTSMQSLSLGARDLVADDSRGLLYLSIAGAAEADGNSVVAVNPLTGVITRRAFVGSEPAVLARSDNAQYLYVALDGASAVRRVDLSTFTAGLQWSLSGGEVAGAIVPIPGLPRSVAVVRQQPGISPPLNGVTVYDDGVARARSSPGHTGANTLVALGSADTLYGFNNSHTGFEFFTLGVDASGVRHLSETSGLIGGFYTNIIGAAGRVYGTNGTVVDAGRLARVGQFSAGSPAMAVDPQLGRVFMRDEIGIAVHDMNNFQRLGSVPITGLPFEPYSMQRAQLVRWGADGVAFLEGSQVVIVRSPLFGR